MESCSLMSKSVHPVVMAASRWAAIDVTENVAVENADFVNNVLCQILSHLTDTSVAHLI